MRIQFLGGASEVGASCTLVEVAGKRILVDAGVRMGEGDPLPDLAALQEGGPIDLVLLTHAHTDHIGALPLVHLAFPKVPVLTTAPSLALMRILLQDALKIMEMRWGRERELPLYPDHAVEGLLSRVQTVAPCEAVPLLAGQVKATWTPSGHVLGACSILLDTPDGRLFFTGDYSIDRQRTVEGMLLPQGPMQAVITEATYGNRIHVHRRTEEERLARSVAAVVGQGGKVLIPAFALGRAQEAVLILLEAQRRGQIPRFPIYVDGMVKSVCSVYASFPEFLSESLRKRVLKEGNPFFGEGLARPVLATEREQLVKGEPCVFIASSGMLTGGPSCFYAQALAPEEKNAIFITGYQDEESPGRRLLDLAEQKERVLRMQGQAIPVACRVEKYNLSAHADCAQMLAVLDRLQPQDVYLVHGDEEARAALAAATPDSMRVHRPLNGSVVELAYGATRKRALAVRPGLGEGELELELLRGKLIARREACERWWTAQELAELWYGLPCTPDQVATARARLQSPDNCWWTSDPKQPFLYRMVRAEEVRTVGKAAARRERQAAAMNQTEVMEEAQRVFGDCPDFYAKGARPGLLELLLSFHFPALARERHAAPLAELAQRSGWKLVLNQHPHQEATLAAARAVLPNGWTLLKTPALYPEGRVRVEVRAPEEQPDTLAVQRAFRERTGLELQVELEGARAPARLSLVPSAAGGQRLEQNQAFQTIRSAFERVGVEVFRASRKTDPSGGEYLELTLVSPRVGERHGDLVEALARETGWPVRINPEPNQDVIKRRTRELVPPGWGLKKEPGFFKVEGYVRVKTEVRPQPEEVRQVSERLERETGYRLEVAG